MNLQNALQQRLADSYRGLQGKDGSGWLSRTQQVERAQAASGNGVKQYAQKPATDGEHVIELPEITRIPFEQAVGDVELHGWEDEWMSSATFDYDKFGPLKEPKIDFVYNCESAGTGQDNQLTLLLGVNGSETEFNEIKHEYEVKSPLNDANSEWISKHSVNRYRDWDELRYSFRSLDLYAKNFVNKIQLLVNSVRNASDADQYSLRPQRPNWLKDNAETRENVQLLAQEDFFAEEAKECVPSFDSVSIESQIHMTPSNVDQVRLLSACRRLLVLTSLQLVALSDDMFLGAPHTAADFYSPLFGSMMAFKPDHYNVKEIKKAEVPTFGEKPYLYYTSWLLNHRFGDRNRKVQAHFSHSISRRVMKEALASFPRPAIRGACERFRGESKFQIYPWYTAFHYSIERFREALLWSFVMTRADTNGDGYLDWTERQTVLEAIEKGRDAVGRGDAFTPVPMAASRDRLYYQLPAIHKAAGLEPPLSNINVLWTSLDGPETIRHVKCHNFHVDKCFSESFDSPVSDASYNNPDFSAAHIFYQLAHREPKCGDCLIKFMLSTTQRGLEPLLPPKSKRREREMVVKALIKYQHTVVDPEAMFVMVKDAEQAKVELLDRAIKRNKHVSQWCLNDDVMTEDNDAVAKINHVIQTVFTTLFPTRGRWEAD